MITVMLAALLGVFISVQPAHAATPVTVRQYTFKGASSINGSTLTLAVTFSGVVMGDTLLVDMAYGTTWAPASGPGLISASDTFTDNYQTVASVCFLNGCGTGSGVSYEAALVTVATAAGSDTVTVVLQGTIIAAPAPTTGKLEGYDLANAGNIAGLSQGGLGTLTPAVTIPSSGIGIAFITNVWAGGPSYTTCNSPTKNQFIADTGFTVEWSQQYCAHASEYNSSAISGASSFVFTISNSQSAIYSKIVVAFAPAIVQSGQGAVILGSCPTKNTATFTLSNTTAYYYTGLATSFTVVNNMTSFVASVTGPTDRIVGLGLYVGLAAGAITNANPLILNKLAALPVIHGVNNQRVGSTVAVAVQPGFYYAVLIVGIDKIKINQSSLSGLASVPGTLNSVPASIGTPSASGSKIFLCASGTFIATTTVSTQVTTTQAATTTFSTTVTSTATTISPQVATNSLTGFVLLLLVLLSPAMALGGVMGVKLGGPGAAVGVVVGLTLGAGIGNLAGILPGAYVFLFIFLDVFILFFAFRAGSGGA